MSNRITDTGLLNRSYNSRALITHQGVTHSLVRATDGTLYAAIKTNAKQQSLLLLRSSDNGFSWNIVYQSDLQNITGYTTNLAGLNQNGPFIQLQLFEELNIIIIWMSFYYASTGHYLVQPWVLNASTFARSSTNTPTSDIIDLNMDQLAFQAPYNENAIFLTYASFSALWVKVYKPTLTAVQENQASLPGKYFNVIGASASPNGWVDIAAVEDNTTTYYIKFTRFTHKSNLFSTPVIIYTSPTTNDISDLNIVRNSYGTLLVTWGEKNTAGTDLDVKYSISTDSGVTWTTPTVLTKEASRSVFVDDITGQMSGRVRAMGGRPNFLLSYCQKNGSGIPKTFVRNISTSNGTTYTIGAEKQIASVATRTTDSICGASFFEPPIGKLLDMEYPGHVRVAYQVGQGDSIFQLDTKPISLGQELLSESAFQTSLGTESGAYSTDSTTYGQILGSMNILGGPNNAVDYYALGAIGPTTKKYKASFAKAGTEVRILKYEPIQTAELSDRSAYSSPVEYVSLAVLSPMTYEFPLAQRGPDSFNTYIERDVRRIHLPPDFYLSRNYILNDGSFLKRTIWTVQFDGNEYEISQVTPFFLKTQICYYSANCYVIGAGYDPFSRVVLPSET